MSQENVELVRRAWKAYSQGGLDAAIESFAPDVEMDLTAGGRVDAGIYHGREGIRRAHETWSSPWESMVMEAKEFIDAGDDQLVVRIEACGRSKQTGLDFELVVYWLYAMREASVVRIREFESREQALEAAGLLE